ncbi:MAG: CehA/McbA family metallohydrolase, partial [bacterium]|nr:CehA/McbA family metallohydrolase [bacterium]
IAAGPPTVSTQPDRSDRRPKKLTGVHTHYDWPTLPHADGDLNLYFGDIHGHSWQSDGMSDPEESFLRVRDLLADDFHALTDHDRFISRRISDGQWQQQKDVVDHYHAPGRFVTLYGQEWTTPRTARPHGWGHFCILSSDPDIPLYDHGDPRYRDLPDLLAALRGRSAVAIPHHIGWTGIRWDVWDSQLCPVIEVCSVHGAFEYEGNQPIPHRGGQRGCFIRDGLAKGLRFGLAGGSDQHGLIWHHGVCRQRDVYRAGLTGVWAPELTRRAILDAIRARHTFATSGVKLRLSFSVDGQMMGSDIEINEAPSIAVDVAVPPREGKLAWLEIVRNGTVINRYGGEGQRSRYTFVDPDCPPGTTSYYYLRVLLSDGNLAWSSPVWATRV